jgi:hypothetical protein
VSFHWFELEGQKLIKHVCHHSNRKKLSSSIEIWGVSFDFEGPVKKFSGNAGVESLDVGKKKVPRELIAIVMYYIIYC